MEVTEKNEGRVISSITQKWKVILETKISDQLKKQSLNFTSKIYCLGVVLELTVLCANLMTWMLKFFVRRTFSNREVGGICGLTCDNKLADPSSSDD